MRDWVYLKIQPYRQLTLSNHHFYKLSSKYYGPYVILERVGSVAYKLSLPPELLLHPKFHVSLLMLCHSILKKISHTHVLDISNPYCPTPLEILQHRIVQKGNRVVVQWLIKWDQIPVENSTWEDANVLKTRFPYFSSFP